METYKKGSRRKQNKQANKSKDTKISDVERIIHLKTYIDQKIAWCINAYGEKKLYQLTDIYKYDLESKLLSHQKLLNFIELMTQISSLIGVVSNNMGSIVMNIGTLKDGTIHVTKDSIANSIMQISISTHDISIDYLNKPNASDIDYIKKIIYLTKFSLISGFHSNSGISGVFLYLQLLLFYILLTLLKNIVH